MLGKVVKTKNGYTIHFNEKPYYAGGKPYEALMAAQAYEDMKVILSKHELEEYPAFVTIK